MDGKILQTSLGQELTLKTRIEISLIEGRWRAFLARSRSESGNEHCTNGESEVSRVRKKVCYLGTFGLLVGML